MRTLCLNLLAFRKEKVSLFEVFFLGWRFFLSLSPVFVESRFIHKEGEAAFEITIFSCKNLYVDV